MHMTVDELLAEIEAAKAKGLIKGDSLVGIGGMGMTGWVTGDLKLKRVLPGVEHATLPVLVIDTIHDSPSCIFAEEVDIVDFPEDDSFWVIGIEPLDGEYVGLGGLVKEIVTAAGWELDSYHNEVPMGSVGADEEAAQNSLQFAGPEVSKVVSVGGREFRVFIPTP